MLVIFIVAFLTVALIVVLSFVPILKKHYKKAPSLLPVIEKLPAVIFILLIVISSKNVS